MVNDHLVPIQRKDVTSGIVDQILGMIRDGYWTDGECLPSQRELAKQMDVSMASLREALSSLQAMGVLEMRQGSGTYVTDQTVVPGEKLIELSLGMAGIDLEMFFEARAVIEPGLAALAAEHATDEQVDRLSKILEDQLAVFDTNDNEQFHELDMAFHQLIAQIANNKFLSQINDTLFKNLDKLFHVLPLTRDGWRLHQDVAEAIRDRSPGRAYATMKTLVTYSAEKYLPFQK